MPKEGKVNLRVEIEPDVSLKLTFMAGERRKAQFIEDVMPALTNIFINVMLGKADPFDPLVRAMLPYATARVRALASGKEEDDQAPEPWRNW
jgi:hypothetical protein